MKARSSKNLGARCENIYRTSRVTLLRRFFSSALMFATEPCSNCDMFFFEPRDVELDATFLEFFVTRTPPVASARADAPPANKERLRAFSAFVCIALHKLLQSYFTSPL